MKQKIVSILALIIVFNFVLTPIVFNENTSNIVHATRETENTDEDSGEEREETQERGSVFTRIKDAATGLWQTVFKGKEGELPEEQYKEDDLDDLEESLEIAFSDEIYGNIIDATFSLEDDKDYFMSRYTNNKDISNATPHVPIFDGKDKFMTWDRDNALYYSKDLMEWNSLKRNIHSEYYIGTSIPWGTASTGGSSIGSSFARKLETIRYSSIHTDTVYNNKGKGIKKKTLQLGIDAYGNIVTNDRNVVVPFYMNTDLIKRAVEKNKAKFPGKYTSSKENMAILGTPLTVRVMNNMAKNKVMYKSDAYLYPFFIDKNGSRIFVADEVPGSKAGRVTVKQLWEWLDKNKGRISEEKTKEYIYHMFKETIEEHHAHFMKKFEENIVKYRAGEKVILPYIGKTTYGNPNLQKTPEEELADATESLGALIKEILTGGMGKLLRLTIAHSVAEAYQQMFIDFSSNTIHYTGYYKDSPLFDNLFGMYVALVVVLLVLYITINTINMARGTLTLSELVGRVGLLLLLTVGPVVIYPKIIDVTFNKSTQRISENDINQMLILDRWVDKAEEQTEELEEKFNFSLDRVFRGNKHNYLIKFTTEQFRNARLDEIVNTYGKIEDEKDLIEIDKERSASKKERVNVYVDAIHLIEYFSEERTESLFDFLSSEYSDIYEGLTSNDGLLEFSDIDTFAGEGRQYTEYRKYIDEINTKGDDYIERGGNFLSSEKLGKDTITASELGARIFKYYKDNDINLGERFRELDKYLLHPYLKNSERDKIISILSDIPSEANKEVISKLEEGDFLNTPEYSKFEREREVLETSNYGDIGDIFGLMTEISVIDGKDVDGINELYMREVAKRINGNIITKYMDTISSVSRMNYDSAGFGDSYNEAEQDVLILNIVFEVLREVDSIHFPTNLAVERVESDVFIRSLIIPIKDITPDNLKLENASLYVGATKDLVALLIFIVLILMLVLYGLLKLVVVSTLLLPVFVVLAVWNYLIISNTKSKLWYGALYILGLFLMVHIGFLGLWRFCGFNMNSALSGKLTGRISFFNTHTNMLIMIVYFIVTTKFIIWPTLKTVKANLGDLGGEQFHSKTMQKVGYLKEWGEDIGNFFKKGSGEGTNEESTIAGKKGDSKKSPEDSKIDRLKRDKKQADALKDEENKGKGRIKGKDGEGKEGEGVTKDEEVEKVKEKIEMGKKKGVKEKVGEGIKSGVDKAKGKIDSKMSPRLKRRLKKAGKVIGGAGKVGKKGVDLAGKGIDKIKGVKPPISKESIERLKDLGIMSAGVGSELVKGKMSTEMMLANGAMALGIEALMRAKGFKTKRDGRKLHIEASEEELAELRDDINSQIEKDRDSIEDIGSKGKTISNVTTTGDKQVSLESNEEVEKYLQELLGEGKIEQLLNDGENIKFRVSGEILDELDLGKLGEITTSDILSMESNDATRQAHDLLREKLGLSGILKDTDGVMEFASDQDTAEVMRTLEEASLDLNNVRGLGVEEKRKVNLNAGNAYVREMLAEGEWDLEEGKDYILSGGEYTTTSEKGEQIFSKIYGELDKKKEQDIASFDEFIEIEIGDSSEFRDSGINTGRKHTVGALSYDANEIFQAVEELKRYKGQEQEMLKLKKELEKAYKMRVEGDNLEIYTDKEFEHAKVQEMMIKIQEMINKGKLS